MTSLNLGTQAEVTVNSTSTNNLNQQSTHNFPKAIMLGILFFLILSAVA